MDTKPFDLIFVSQFAPVPGDVRANMDLIVADITEAKLKGAELVIFPELATTGYLIGDRFEYADFIEEVRVCDELIREATLKFELTAIWGSVVKHEHEVGDDGRERKFNAARIASHGKWLGNGYMLGYIAKANLPKYRIFDDARQFSPLHTLTRSKVPIQKLMQPFPVPIGGKILKIAITICEDLWEDDYAVKPSEVYAKTDADLMVNISCSPWTEGKVGARKRMLHDRAITFGKPIIYANAVGLQNNVKNLVWFDGGSCVAIPGKVCALAMPHEIQMVRASDMHEFVEEDPVAEVCDVIVHAMREMLSGFPRVVIGLSGGIDSAVSAALLVKALGNEKVLGINMPTENNSITTRELAHRLAKSLDIEYDVVLIQGLYDAHRQMLSDAGYANPKQITLENVQARIRGASVLAAIAQEEGGVFVCNGNKTEIALNYFTLYADGAGIAAFFGDLWKGGMYDIGRYINSCAGREVIPHEIFDIVPSAELSRDQNVDEGKGDPIFYPYHDKLLAAFTERRIGPELILGAVVIEAAATQLPDIYLDNLLGCESGTVARYFDFRTKEGREKFVANLEWCWQQYNIEFKRAQTPPILLLSRRAFGFDRRDTIGVFALTSRYKELKQMFLEG